MIYSIIEESRDKRVMDFSCIPISGYPVVMRIHNFPNLKYLNIGGHLESFITYTNTPIIFNCPKLKVILVDKIRYSCKISAKLLLLCDVSQHLIYGNISHKKLNFDSLIHIFDDNSTTKMKSLII